MQLPTSPAESKGKALIWLCFLAATAWAVLLRLPLILNAGIHLDSDLAVDGLTLLDAVQGRWRWHYPGTPFSGILPVCLSWVQARFWGTSPETLVSGGVVAHILLMLGVFGLAWRNHGRVAAIGSLVPLTFASTGVLWLSGRITGGHLPVTAWSAAAWLLLSETLRRGDWRLYAGLGVWCGLGLYLDSMFAITLVGMLVTFAVLGLARFVSEVDGSRPSVGRLAACGLALAIGLVAGASPRAIGQRLEPHDAYREQFEVNLRTETLVQHARLLALDCLPRLIAGHRLPGLETDPDPRLLGSDAPVRRSGPGREASRLIPLLTTAISLGAFVVSLLTLAGEVWRGKEPAGRAVAAGLLAASLGVAGGFLANRNVFNADNYRYLVLLLIPWSIGFGVWLDRLCRKGGVARWAGLAVAFSMAAVFTADAIAWYRQFQWIDDRLIPVQRPWDDPAVAWLREHGEVQSILGGYWDVYRLCFLTGGSVRGIPYAIFPNRFPEWSEGMPAGRPQTLIARQTPDGMRFMDAALREGGKVLHRRGGLTFVHWPWPGTPDARSVRP